MRRLSILLLVAIASLAGLILAAMMSYLPNHLPDPFQGRSPLFFGIATTLIIFIVGGAVIQVIQGELLSPTADEATRDKDQAQRNRDAMLKQVRTTWIAGVLDRSVAKDARIALGLESRPDAVIDPVDLVVQRPKLPPQSLPAGTAIRNVYDQMGGALLILGTPGAGKTTLLLELARDLLDRANDDPQHPIPVVFPLSTWVAQRRPLAEWLVDELALRYQVSRKLAQTWIDADAILPLLDGLDEVAVPHRNACADAINAYRQTRGHLPLVVASRIADYEALTTRLQLRGAIVAQPLSRDQVRTYLRAVGIPAIPTRDSPLWELLDTPLMLTVAALAYAGQSLAALPADPVAAHDQLFAAYIDRMFERNNPQRPFTDDQTRHYLAYLAHHMYEHNQTTLYLEQLQTDWLPPKRRKISQLAIGVSFGLLYGLSVGLVGWLLGRMVIGGRVGGLFFGLSLALATVLLVLQKSYHGVPIQPVEAIHWSWTNARSSFTGGLRLTSTIGVFFGMGVALINTLLLGASFGVLTTLLLGLLDTISGGLSHRGIVQKVVPNQGIRQSRKYAVVIGGGLGLLFGSGLGLAVVRWASQDEGVLVGLFAGVGFGLLFGLQHGGRAYIQHYALRLLLIRNGSIPRRLVPFLEYATQRIFLRHVGGGYLFIHRLLLEHFAAQYTPPHTTRP